MNNIIIKLDNQLCDTLQYHNEFVRLVTVVHKSTLVYPIDHDHGCMRFTLKSGFQTYNVIIDINDLFKRLLDLLVKELSAMGPTTLTHFQVETLLGLCSVARKLAFSDVHLYWLEWKYALADETIEQCLKLHRLEKHSDTLHTCMYILSVLNDCYKMESEAQRFEDITYPNFSKSAITGSLAEDIYDTPNFIAGRCGDIAYTSSDYLVEWVDDYLASIHLNYRKDLCRHFEFTLSYQQAYRKSSKIMVAYQIVREVVSVLCAFPLSYDLESTPVSR